MRGRLLKAFGTILVLCAAAVPLRPDVRTVGLRIVADEEFRSLHAGAPGEWAMFARRLLGPVAADFERRFGLRLSVAGVGEWESDDGRRTVRGLLNDLSAGPRRGRAEVLVGFTAQPGITERLAGGACMNRALVLVRMAEPVSIMKSVLKHELCHVFGAVDIREPGSVMDLTERVRGDGFDALTAGLVAAHKEREFGVVRDYPAGADIDAALFLCEERHRAAPEEVPVMVRLACLRYAKKDMAAVRDLSTDVLALEPDLAEVRNLLGIALDALGENALAEQAFEEAVRSSPEFPEPYLNLADCRLKRGDAAGAERCCRQALEVLPASSEAHEFLGWILEGRSRMVEAVRQYRLAMTVEPRLKGRLLPRIRKIS